MEWKGKCRIKLDTGLEYGLVLEGGGARGAYQIGAWKALREAGIKIKGVSGTSVGALNGAMICMDDFEVAEDIWTNMHYSSVMDVQDDIMEGIVRGDFKKLNPQETVKDILKHLTDGGFDTMPLRRMIDERIPAYKIKNSKIDFYFKVFSVSGLKEMCIDAKELADEDMTNMLLASSYLPVFKRDGDLGRKLVDGGFADNLPIDALIDRGYKNIISIRIYGIGVAKKVAIPEDVNVYEIAPRIGLGSILEFDEKRTRRNIRAGYYDALRFLYDLLGTIYYIDSELSEEECLRELIRLSEADVSKGDDREELSLRTVTERLLPQLALQLRLGLRWDYKRLYFAMLEATAKLLKIQKYSIYTMQEFKIQIAGRWRELPDEKKEKLPDFARNAVLLCQ